MPSWETFVASLQGVSLEHERHPPLSDMEAAVVAALRDLAAHAAKHER